MGQNYRDVPGHRDHGVHAIGRALLGKTRMDVDKLSTHPLVAFAEEQGIAG
jgi:hypothetical protein